jgi:Ca2+-binding RTX toxin-like protein
MATATIVGGASVELQLGSREALFAQMALTAAGDGYKNGKVYDHLGADVNPRKFAAFAVTGAEGKTLVLPMLGNALIAEGTTDVGLVGHAGTEVLIGNSGNDTINAAGGNGTIISGDGDNLIQLNSQGAGGGRQYIVTGAGADTIDSYGGKATINNETLADVVIHAGHTSLVGLNDLDVTIKAGVNILDLTGNDSVSISGGTNTLDLSGNDTITFGRGNDTIVEHGTSTITASAAGVLVQSGLGTASMAAGSGSSTLIGGTGADTLVGGAGVTSMIGGQSANTFLGGAGQDTMVGGGTSNLFIFEANHAGGTHEIDGFVHGSDKIDLVGYSLNFSQDVKEVGGNAVISLDGGHTIITVEDTTLTRHDFGH